MDESKPVRLNNPLNFLRQYTSARVALGNTGVSMLTNEHLALKLAHAKAKDAVFAKMDIGRLFQELQVYTNEVLVLRGKAVSREEYLLRPDYGGKLNEKSAEQLLSFRARNEADVAIIIADGLSAAAVNHHALPLISLLMDFFGKKKFVVAPFSLVEQGRVAIGDEIGACLNAKVSLILLGERPGLSAPDSLGAYLTYAPSVGKNNSQRNCVSNIRPDGLNYQEAARLIGGLISDSLQLKISGVLLKESPGNKSLD